MKAFNDYFLNFDIFGLNLLNFTFKMTNLLTDLFFFIEEFSNVIFFSFQKIIMYHSIFSVDFLFKEINIMIYNVSHHKKFPLENFFFYRIS